MGTNDEQADSHPLVLELVGRLGLYQRWLQGLISVLATTVACGVSKPLT
jgi:hypothetical protein